LDVGATLFIGNLDPEVDEKMLYDTFSAFGLIVHTPKISRDPETGGVKGFGFISFDNFESADAAIDAMEGQYLMNKQITVSYAFKKDGKGERHGSAAERLLAAEARKNVQMPNRLYSGGPVMAPALGTGSHNTPTYAANNTPQQQFSRPPPPPPPMGGPNGYPNQQQQPPIGYAPQQQQYGQSAWQ
jgi:splicing factor 3B subunit 4